MGRTGLGIFGAVAKSAFNDSLDFFPRASTGGGADASSAESIMPDLSKAMTRWDKLKGADECSLDEAIDMAKASLAEVKAATEYQDGKASRLLTVTSFVSALAGFLFNAFSVSYPPDSLRPFIDWRDLLPISAYVLFLAFVLSALGGALTTFHATRTRFKYPVSPRPGQDGVALSYLFHGGILGVSPTAWAESFVSDQAGSPAFRNLKLGYLRNYVAESYLVAAKTADKLRFLEPAQSMLSWALRFLLLFAVAYTATVIALPPTKAASNPVTVMLEQAGRPAMVTIVPAPRK